MSLEQHINELNASVQANTEVLQKLLALKTGDVAAGGAPEKTVTKKPAAKKEAEKPAATSEPTAEKQDDFVGLDYEQDVKPAVLAAAAMSTVPGELYTTGREVVVDVLSSFGAKKATGLDVEQYQPFLDLLQKGLEGEAV